MKPKQEALLRQSQYINDITYDKAFKQYLSLCKSKNNEICNVYLTFKDGEEVFLKIHSIEDRIQDSKGRDLKIVDDVGVKKVWITKTKLYPIAFLRAYAFIPCLDRTKDYRVSHKDNDKTNDVLSNLEWVRQY